jgi:hypothetical protein
MLYESIKRLEVAGEKLLHVGVGAVQMGRWREFASRVRTTSLRASRTNRIELSVNAGEMRTR